MDRSERTDGLVDAVLAHFGVVGMKWGVRRNAPRPTDSTDAIQTREFKARVKKGSTNALSTRELQLLVNRMNLERQYKTLQGDSAFKRGTQITRDLLNAGKLGIEVANTVKKATGK